MTDFADIVIVNWNSGTLLAECIASLAQFPTRIGRVIVVDNGSTDQSADLPDSLLDLVIMPLGQNVGFARACNIGAELSSQPYILFLNPDTRFLNNEALPEILSFMDRESSTNIGITGIRLVDEGGKTQQTCANFTNIRTYIGQPFYLDKIFPSIFTPLFASFDYTKSRDVDQAIGAYFLVRRKTFLDLQGFDERFFVYWEEVDFCLRARKIGWRTYYFADSVAFHKGNGSSDRVKAKRLFYELRSRVLYAFKHFSWVEGYVILFLAAAIEPISKLMLSILRGSSENFFDTISGYRLFWSAIPEILKSKEH